MSDLRLGIALAALVALTAVVPLRLGVAIGRSAALAAVRASVQLGLVGLVLGVVVTRLPLALLAVSVMGVVAVFTARARARGLPAPGGWAVGAGVATGTAVTLGVVFATGAQPLTGRSLIALGGIVLGGGMTVSTLAGRRYVAGLVTARDEIEGWLALGAGPRTAVRRIVQESLREALLPALDSTATVGLVTLPGSFVGSLLAGASPAASARFQVLVLVALLCAEAIAAVVLLDLAGAPRTLPGPPPVRAPRRH